MIKCPKCGGAETTEVKEQVTQSYRKCSNCGYTPSFDKVEPRDAKDWVHELQQARNALLEERDQLEADTSPARPTLHAAKKNRNERLLEESTTKLEIANSVSEIVDLLEKGQITIHAPQLGVLVQFTWGDFSLFESIGKAE